MSRGPTRFVNIYPELVVQHDVSIRVDEPVESSSPVEPGTPLMDNDSASSFADDTYVQGVRVALYFTKFRSMQEEYLLTGTTVE